MMKKILVINSLLLAFSLVLTACTAAAAPTQDPNQLAAQVAALVDAQVATKVAQALAALPTQQPAQPTNNPLIPTIGPIPTLAPVNIPTLSLPGVATGIPCLATPRSESENYPDGTTLYPNFAFTKKWTISNQGSCTWNANYKLKFVSGDQMGGPSFKLFGVSVPPWQTITLELPLKTTSSVGTSTGYWGLYDDKDVYFGRVWVTINRVAIVPTANTFRVDSANTTVNTAAPASCVVPYDFVFSSTITVNAAGTVTYHWVRSDGSTSSPSETKTFSAAGSQVATYTWQLGAGSGTSWVKIYIESPNNQEWNQVTVTCP
jgi:hypothetical protein